MGSRFRVAGIARDHNMHEKSEDLPTGRQRVVAAEKDGNIKHHIKASVAFRCGWGPGSGDDLCNSLPPT